MFPTDFLIFLQIIIFLFITPGAPRVLIVSHTLNYTLRRSVWTAFGDISANIFQGILVVFFIGTFLKNNPEIMILMFQKEFAERLIDKKLNSINSLIKCFFNVKVEFHVSKNCFRPIPKIESSVLKFEKLNKSLIAKDEIKSFINFKRHVFSYKRKTLGKVLRKYSIPEMFKLNLRAENLNIIEFIKIFKSIKF